MIEFGRTLRAAREARGLTIAQVAETTHMAPSSVEDLERENFSRIVAPIYGRGFVKLYCEAVGLDPKPLVAEFMEIYNGNRNTEIKERPVGTPAPASVHAPKPEPAPCEPEAAPAEQYAAPAEPAPTSEQLPADDLFAMPAQEPVQPRLSRYAAPVSQRPERNWSEFAGGMLLQSSFWRIGAVAVVAVVLLCIAFIGVRALYRATSAQTDADVQTPSPAVQEPAPAVQKPAPTTAQRTPQDIPALYID